ncbi:MAG: ECF-type sigma factor [Verrucomicrobiota bacterium]
MDALTRILQAACGDDHFASEELLPLVYDELRHLAAARMAEEAPNQTLQPTALVHEAWLRIAGEGGLKWNGRGHFFGAAALAMRRILVDRARGKASLKRGRNTELLDIDDVILMEAPPDERVLLIDEMLQRLEVEDPVSARVVTLKFFGGLTNKEIAEVQGVTERTAERRWAYARASLYEMIREDAP